MYSNPPPQKARVWAEGSQISYFGVGLGQHNWWRANPHRQVGRVKRLSAAFQASKWRCGRLKLRSSVDGLLPATTKLCQMFDPVCWLDFQHTGEMQKRPDRRLR